jgi:hypothetical protein
LNNKVVNSIGLVSILGISYDGLAEMADGLNPGGNAFVKKFKQDYEQTHESKLNDKGINAVGVIAILNHRFNWNDNGNQNNKIIVNVSGQGLPDLSGSAEILPEMNEIKAIGDNTKA